MKGTMQSLILYRIRIQPSPYKTLNDPGVIDTTIHVTAQNIAGIKAAIDDMLARDYPIQAQVINLISHHDEGYRTGMSSQVSLPGVQEDTFVTSLVVTSRGRPEVGMDDIIRGATTEPVITKYVDSMRCSLLPSHYTVMPNVSRQIERNADSLHDYTCIISSLPAGPDVMRITIMAGTFTLRTFDSPEFIQGVITVCMWTGRNWKEHIKLPRYRDQLLNLTM